MIKSPITKNGELRYLQVIIYSITIGLFIMGYITIVDQVKTLSIVHSSIIVSILLIIFLTQLVVSIVIELIDLLHYITKPITQYVDNLVYLVPHIRKTENRKYIVEISLNTQSEFCVFRC